MQQNHYRSLLKLGLPIVVGQLGIIVVGFADTMMVGRYSTNDLAAASFVNQMFNLAIVFAMGFSYGLTPVVGGLFGRNEKERIGGALKNGLAANAVVAVFLTAIMYILYLNIHRLNQPVELLPLMRPYYIILLISLIFVMLFNAFKQFADGITDTKTSMWILISGNIINILGNWLLIYGKLGFPELGLLGAGLATLFSRIAMLAIFVIIFFTSKRYNVYKQGFITSVINKTEYLKLNKLGMPVALQMGMETASFSLTAIMVGWLGATALAAHQIMVTVGQLGFMMYYGMAAAVAVATSNYHGKKDYANIQSTASSGFHIILAMAITVCIPLFLLRGIIGDWFTSSTEVTAMVAQLIIPFIIYQFGDGLQCNYSNALRGISDVKPVMLYAFIAYFIISLPSGYLFGIMLGWGITGIWLSFPLGLTSAGLMFYLRFRHNLKKKYAVILNMYC